jgi:hypothetical protein
MAKATNSYIASEWYAALTTYLRDIERPGKSDRRVEQLEDRLIAATKAAWQRPVKGFDDLVLLAGVCAHWCGPLDDILALPNNLDQRSVAYLVRGILQLAGFELDAEGRVLSRILSRQAGPKQPSV